MVERAVCVPARCPAMRGRWRRCAQRPLPSMMTATWRGKRVRSSPEVSSDGTWSDLHDLVFFGLQHLVQPLGVFLGELLGLLLAPVHLVLRELAVLLELLEQLVRVAPVIAHRHSILLGGLADVLHQVPPPLLGELGDGDANE